ncbi:hypothetical protein F4804DRAFT_314917 [Jackrogersella minutella]|nr:hypothetical protein F4804DRAFT_314917 [Jackrogersella minutella]
MAHNGNELYEVRNTEGRGMSAFAIRDIRAGERILTDKCHITNTDHRTFGEDWQDLMDNFFRLSKQAQDQVLELYAYEPPERINQVRNALPPNSLTPETLESYCHIFFTFQSNCFEVQPSIHNLDGSIHRDHKSGLFLKASRFNHSCDPNLTYNTTSIPGYYVLTAARGIKAGEELSITYIPLYGMRKERQYALRGWGFECTCPRCEGQDSEYDERLQEAILEHRRATGNESAKLPPSRRPQEGEEASIDMINRRIVLLEELQWLPELYFAYMDSGRFHLEEFGQLEEKDIDGATNALRTGLGLLFRAAEAAQQVWSDQNILVVEVQQEIEGVRGVLDSI